MKFIKELNKVQLIVLILTILILISSIIFLCVRNYKEKQIPSISYRVYTKENGWSKWCKDGDTCGDKKNDILKIEYKLSSQFEDSFAYTIYSDKYIDGEFFNYDEKIEKSKIYGISYSLNSEMIQKYDICYRTYNKTDKWLDWTWDDSISGNKEEKITAIGIKLIDKRSVKREQLDSYGEAKNSQRNFGGK